MKISVYAPYANERFETARQRSILHLERIAGNSQRWDFFCLPVIRSGLRRSEQVRRHCTLVGQSTIFTMTSDRATGDAYTLARHVTVDGGRQRLMLASLRYLDTFVKMDRAWLFAERLLHIDWIEERAQS